MKYRVEIGGFVNTFLKSEDEFDDRFRHRSLIIHAKSEEEAKEKAQDKFFYLCQKRAGNLCDDCVIDSVTLIEK